jgi:4-amino-4-deoxy-L-arabinose transferase-like glycosyltransferase
MGTLKQRIEHHKLFLLYMGLYFLVSAALLTRFPYMHSDEPWLGALSRSMLLQGDYSVTEPFFDVYARNPHAIRLLFHMLQSGVIALFGYGLIPLRMISLVFGMGSLTMMYRIGLTLWKNRGSALVATMFLSLDVWFIYASHFARQEIVLLFLLLTATALLLKSLGRPSVRQDVAMGVLLGLGIGIHPNSFVLALSLGSIYLYLIFKGERTWKSLWVLMTTVSAFALLFVGLSLVMDPNYVANYIQNGEKFGVNRSLWEKIFALRDFFMDLWNREGLTYFIPDMRLPFLLFGSALGWTAVDAFRRGKKSSDVNPGTWLLIGFFALLVGILLIGRYNPTSVVLLFPFLYLLLGLAIFSHWKRFGTIFLVCLLLFNGWINRPTYHSSYSSYETQIAEIVAPNEKSLANLNLGLYFDEGSLLDYRNLRYYRQAGFTLEEYIRSRDIEYIFFSNELDRINEKKPAYNGVYGNPDFYYEELVAFLKEHGQPVGTVINPTYGVHVANWVDQEPWQITIFKVTTPP